MAGEWYRKVIITSNRKEVGVTSVWWETKRMLYVEAIFNALEGGHTKFQFEQILAF